MSNRKLGNDGENAVANLLRSDQFTILERNYKKFFGEIDIIAKRDELIAFVEVKTRKSNKISMFDLVGLQKQRKIALVAKEYISKIGNPEFTFRFDVALVHPNEIGELKIKYVRNAFSQKEGP